MCASRAVGRASPLWLVAFGLALSGCAGEEAGEGVSRADAELEEARSGFVETEDGERIHYVSAGERRGDSQPAILFVPGWTMTTEIWRPQLDHFSRTHRVVAMDPRSQGRSSKARDGHTASVRGADIGAVVNALDLRPVVLVGWSMAVTEIVAYVDRHGTHGVTGLVLVDGVAGQDWEPDMALVFMNWTADFVHDRGTATEAFVRGMYRKPHSEAYLSSVVSQSLQTPTDAAAALIVGAARNDFRSSLPNLDRPVLVVATTGSPWGPVYEEMASSIPDARLQWFPEAGHALFVDEPEAFNELLESFLQDLLPPS